MYHQFNTQRFYFLPTKCIFEFCVDLRTKSNYFPIQHYLLSSVTNTDFARCEAVNEELHMSLTVGLLQGIQQYIKKTFLLKPL